MGISGYHLNQRNSLNSVRFVTHKGNSMKVSTTTKRGVVGFRMSTTTSTGGHRLIQKGSKTTKFIPSEPVIKFEGEPPF